VKYRIIVLFHFSHRLGVDRVERYKRNQMTISSTEQMLLGSKRVAVIGCGGLGGFVIEGLIRLGVTQLVLVDSDVFEVSNLNRQLLSSESVLGLSKVRVAAQRVKEIDNCAIVQQYELRVDANNIDFVIHQCDLIVDCTDNAATKRLLMDYALSKHIPLVYGAVAGYYGQAAVILQSVVGLDALFVKDKGLESKLGNPYFIVGMVGSLQVYLCYQVLLNKEVSQGMYYLDLKSQEMAFVDWL
jgi:molybdopterin-synthase adenylyltransferase